MSNGMLLWSCPGSIEIAKFLFIFSQLNFRKIPLVKWPKSRLRKLSHILFLFWVENGSSNPLFYKRRVPRNIPSRVTLSVLLAVRQLPKRVAYSGSLPFLIASLLSPLPHLEQACSRESWSGLTCPDLASSGNFYINNLTSSPLSVRHLQLTAGGYYFWLKSHLVNLCDWNYWWLTGKKEKERSMPTQEPSQLWWSSLWQKMLAKASHIGTYSIHPKCPKNLPLVTDSLNGRRTDWRIKV